MSWVSVVTARLRSLFEHRRSERNLDDEVRFHLEMQMEESEKSRQQEQSSEPRYPGVFSYE